MSGTSLLKQEKKQQQKICLMDEFKGAGLEDFVENSYGYAAFPKVGKFAFIVGFGGAAGTVYVNGRKVGTAKLMMGSAGWSLGLTTYSEIIFFKDEDAFDKFTDGNGYAFEAGAKAHVLKAGASAAARTTGASANTSGEGSAAGGYAANGMATFVIPKMGAMIDVSAEGQKFSYSPEL